MNHPMSRMAVVAAFALTLAGLVAHPAAASPSDTVLVVNANDDGPGSFRAAVARANADEAVERIVFLGRVRTIVLQQTVLFTGAQDLSIDGNGATLDGAGAGGAAFLATGGGNLAVANLAVRDAPAEGIAIQVPPAAKGTIHVWLFRVEIIGNLGHGILVNDQVDPTTTDGVQPNAAGSPASIQVTVLNSRFVGNGYSVSDRDGLRVNEGGDGDLLITVTFSEAVDNAADGIEVDERGVGDVQVRMLGSRVLRNGQFDSEDLDDGFDIDEYNEGSIRGFVALSSANDNFEEGFDFNENNAGDLRVDLWQVEASRNREEGIDYEEDDDFAGGGDLVATMTGVVANGNGADGGDAGLKIREKGAGHLAATLNWVQTTDNLIKGINLQEDADGSLWTSIARAWSVGNIGRGLDLDENAAGAADAAGDLVARVSDSTFLNNGQFDIRADQTTPPGAGTLILSNVTFNLPVGGNVTPTIVP